MDGSINVILGCYGRTDDDFVSCSSLNNIILLAHPKDSTYNDMMDYFDGVRLFERTIMDYNSVRHVIFNLQDKFEMAHKKLWSEKMFKLYQKFTIDHKDCGIYIKLEAK